LAGLPLLLLLLRLRLLVRRLSWLGLRLLRLIAACFVALIRLLRGLRL